MERQTFHQVSSEERMLAIVSCVTAHMGFGVIPLIIFALKRKESKYVAYYASIGAMTGGLFIASIVLFVVGNIVGVTAALGGAASSNAVGGLVSVLGSVIMFLSWPVMLLAFPVMLVIMFLSAVAAYHNRLVEWPLLSKWARKLAGIGLAA